MKLRKRPVPALAVFLMILAALLPAAPPAWGSEPRQGSGCWLSGLTTRPSIYYANAGAVFEVRSDGSTLRRGRLADLSRMLDAVDYDSRTLVLSEKGLQSVVPQDGAGVIARFTGGDARLGRLIGMPDNSRIIYQYWRDNASFVGVFDK